MSATLDVSELADAIEIGNARSIFAFLDTGNVGGLNAAAFAASSYRLRVMTLGVELTPLVHGRNVERGALMAEALFLTTQRAWKRDGDPVSAENYGSAADLLATAWQRQGRHADVVALAREVAPTILEHTNGYRSTSLVTRAVDALIDLGDLREAEALLAEVKRYDDRYLAASGQRDPNLPFTEKRLHDALVPVIEAADTRSPDEKARDEHKESIEEVINAIARLQGVPQELQSLLQEAGDKDEGPKDQREVLVRVSEEMRTAVARFGLGDELARHQFVLHDAGRLLLDPKSGHDSAQLRLMRERLVETQTWFAQEGHKLDALDALWPIAVISRRLQEHDAALDFMQRIRETIERRRLGIADPLQTAALFTRFPHLYVNMVLSALELDRLDEALSAMEASKGRAIAELRAVRSVDVAEGMARETLEATAATEHLDAFLEALQVDYLSFFVDDEETIGVLATPAGDRHLSRIAIGKNRLAKLMRQVDPNGWSLFGATALDRELAPLVAWVLPHLTRTVLIISPDDPLHNLPFHYLETPEGRLIDHVATAKVHGVSDLRVLYENPSARPERAKAAFVPARDEGGPVADREAAFTRLCQNLPLPVEILTGVRFDRASASALTVPGQLLHLAAHGYWPSARRGAQATALPNPYRASGLLLARDGRLPERGEPSEDELLSPALVMESDAICVDRAVIGVQACVSGLSIEGRAGDALGLEWALVAKGAATVLASHWDVPFTSAVAFFERFYQAWLIDGLSRAEASRCAMLALRDDPQFAAYGLEWAAFTLIGDWR